MNHKETLELLEIVKAYIDEQDISVSTKNTDWKGKEENSDYIIFDDKNGVGFKVFENEIIMFFFSEHHHFEDYSFELTEGAPNYVERAKKFLSDLFCCTITHQSNYKGNVLTSEKIIFTYPDGTVDCPAGTWVHKILIRFVPFLPKRTELKSWIFDKYKKRFTNCFPKSPDPNAVEVIDVNEDCYIEILHNNGLYRYTIMEKDFDDYNGIYFWAPKISAHSGMYDTKENALKHAYEDLNIK